MFLNKKHLIAVKNLEKTYAVHQKLNDSEAVFLIRKIKTMKRSTILSALLSWGCSAILMAQSPASPRMPVDDATNLITFTDVVEEPGMSKDTLYNRALRWFKTFYKNPVDAIKNADAAGYKIEGGYRFTIKRPDPGSKKEPVPMVDAGVVNYKINIMCKDSKFKYEITSMSWKQASYYPIERWMDTAAKNYDPNFALYLKQTDEYVKDLIKSLENYIETDPVKKKDDW